MNLPFFSPEQRLFLSGQQPKINLSLEFISQCQRHMALVVDLRLQKGIILLDNSMKRGEWKLCNGSSGSGEGTRCWMDETHPLSWAVKGLSHRAGCGGT